MPARKRYYCPACGSRIKFRPPATSTQTMLARPRNGFAYAMRGGREVLMCSPKCAARPEASDRGCTQAGDVAPRAAVEAARTTLLDRRRIEEMARERSLSKRIAKAFRYAAKRKHTTVVASRELLGVTVGVRCAWCKKTFGPEGKRFECVVLIAGEERSVRACSAHCQEAACTQYEEVKTWLKEERRELKRGEMVRRALQLYLTGARREASQSQPPESRPEVSLPN